MTTPTLLFEIAFTDPTEPPVWVTETDNVRRFSTRRGRSNELDKVQAGTANLTVDNRDGRFTAHNTSGTYYPDVRPMRLVRISAQVPSGASAFTVGSSSVGSAFYVGGAETLSYAIFTGYVEDWPLSWDPSNKDGTAEVIATDGFLPLSLSRFDFANAFLSMEPSGSRVSRILEQMGWPFSFDRVDLGTVYIHGEASGASEIHEQALTHLQAVADTEGGVAFMDVNGDVAFHAADHDPEIDPTEIYGDASGEIRYTDISIETGANRIQNDITVSTPSDGPITRTSVTSIARHFRRSVSYSLLRSEPIAGGSISEVRAAALRDRYASPRQRIAQLELRPRTDTEWARVLAHEIGDVVLVRKRPLSGDMIEQVSRIEGISFDSPNTADWRVVWELSEHDTEPVSMLTENQQSLETSTTGWIAETSCTISRTTDVAFEGDYSLLVHPSALPFSAKTDPNTGISATAGSAYRAVAGVRSVSGLVPMTARVELAWYSSVPALISTTVGTYQTLFTGAWSFPEVEGTAPGSTAYVVVRLAFDGFAFLGGTFNDIAADLIDLYEIT